MGPSRARCSLRSASWHLGGIGGSFWVPLKGSIRVPLKGSIRVPVVPLEESIRVPWRLGGIGGSNVGGP